MRRSLTLMMAAVLALTLTGITSCKSDSGAQKAVVLAEAVCDCSDADCSSTKLQLLGGYVNDYVETNPPEDDAIAAMDALSRGRTCAARNGVGPFAKH